MSIQRVELRTNEYERGPVDQVVLIGFDMQLKTDVRSAREIKLAQRMAEGLGIELVDCRAALSRTEAQQ